MAQAPAVEPDAAKRKQLYNEVNDYILDESWAAVMTPYPDIVLMRPNVMDLKYFLCTATNDRNIWLS